MGNFECRKGKKLIRLLDNQGRPVCSKRIEIRQKQHEFLFGCGAFDFLAYIMNFMPDMKEQFHERTLLWEEVFNYGTIPVYWGMFEKEEGKPNTELTRKIGEYLYSRDIAVKGHPLCWHTVCADWLLKYDNPTIFSKQIERIHRDVSDLKDYFKYWDVINEVVIMPRFDKYDNAITRICKEYGQVELVKKVFQAAKETDPFATLLINDFNTSKAYEDLIERCLDAGIEISAIGIQSHQHQGYWGKEKILDVLERFSRFGLPIHFTENTIVSGTLVPKEIEDLNDWQVESWPSLPEYEALQAEQLEEMYTILFSYPFVKAITQWDFTDGAWLKAPSGLIRQDNTVKPAYTMLKNKIKKQWFTERFETTTNDSGCALVEGFKGKYDLYVDEQRYDFVLDDKGEDLVLHIL